MKPFVFRLDSILQLRAREEARAQEIFEQATHACDRAGLELTDARQELAGIEQAITGQRSGCVKGSEHVIFLNAAKVRRECCDRLAARLDAAQKEMEAQRGLFQAARRRHEAMIRLRDRHRCAHAAAEQRREEAAISDLIMSRHALASHSAPFSMNSTAIHHHASGDNSVILP